MLGECPNGRGAKTSTSRAHRPRVDVKAQNEHGVSALELFFMAGYDCIYEEFEDFGDDGVFRSIGNEVLEAFEKAGYDIMAMMGMDSRFCLWWLVSCLIVSLQVSEVEF